MFASAAGSTARNDPLAPGPVGAILPAPTAAGPSRPVGRPAKPPASDGRGRHRLGAALAAAVLLWAAPSRAGQVVLIRSSDADPYRQTEAELKKRLAKLGHTLRGMPLNAFARDPLAAGRDADAFVAVGTKAASWLNRHLPRPAKLAYCMVSHPTAAGLDAGHRPRGVSINVPEATQFRLIAEALPSARCVGMLYRGKTEAGKRLLARARRALPKGWRLEAVDVEKHDAVAKAIDALLARNVDVVWTVPDASIYDVPAVRSLLLTAIRRKTPVFGFSPAFVRAGALLGVGIDPKAQAAQAAEITHRLLTRTASAPATRPEGPTTRPVPRFEIAVNLVVARKLSLALPETLVRRAAFVFGARKEKQ